MKFKIINLLVIFLIAAGFSGCAKKTIEKTNETGMTPNNLQKKAILIIAHEGFQNIEYETTRKVLEQAGINITIASSKTGEAESKTGLITETVKVDKTINEIRVEDFDVVVFIGGPGAKLEFVENSTAHQLAQETVSKEKILAAICIAPEILAKAGVLNGKKATVWSDPTVDLTPIQFLKDNGAEYMTEDVVVDGKIVTANGPLAAEKFGQKIVELLGL